MAEGPVGLAQQVYETVKSRVLTSQYAPGTLVAANRIAQELGVSRSPANQALQQLASEGLLVPQQRNGYVVPALTVHGLRDLFEVRMTLEALNAELAARRCTPEDAARFEAEEARMEELAEHVAGRTSSDPEVVGALLTAHSRYHALISEAAHNARLAPMLRALQDESQRYWFVAPALRHAGIDLWGVSGHRQITQAIVAGDPARARAAIADHIRSGLQHILDALQPETPAPAPDLEIL